MTRDDFLFSLGRLDQQLKALDNKLGKMCSKLDSMSAKTEAA